MFWGGFVVGERFEVSYLIGADYKQSVEMAKDICLEQTVEIPIDLVPEGHIKENILGRLEDIVECEKGFRAIISFDEDITAFEITGFLNVLFGNISLKPGIEVESFKLTPNMAKYFKGPKFGRDGIRKCINNNNRPILATALKPMGLSAKDFSEYAYKFALGGIDIIKDDHGLSNQSYASFDERVKYCAEAVQRANAKTGLNCVYAPNVTAEHADVYKRTVIAKENGAGALLIAPGLAGFSVMKNLSEDKDLNLPLISHPSFLGSFVTGVGGLSHYTLFGQIMRLSGADASIYPNFGGRFSFSKKECSNIVEGTNCEMSNIKPIFPMPGGGMKIEKMQEMKSFYQNDVIYLMGGGLVSCGADLVSNCRTFRDALA